MHSRLLPFTKLSLPEPFPECLARIPEPFPVLQLKEPNGSFQTDAGYFGVIRSMDSKFPATSGALIEKLWEEMFEPVACLEVQLRTAIRELWSTGNCGPNGFVAGRSNSMRRPLGWIEYSFYPALNKLTLVNCPELPAIIPIGHDVIYGLYMHVPF
ncbi:MAG: hypothetical protein JWN37_537 [Candidatus Nomurabacteria bacterium]|nr:hypothetical protein [Candidatus Nomurabacteria bacterium]